MKSTAWKKDYLVVIHSDYDNTWRDLTVPLTFMQAIRFVRAKGWTDSKSVRIVNLSEWAKLVTSINLSNNPTVA
jgi:hypothetical protein